LSARRGLVRPSDHGLPGGSRRRVAGLRREEVALLAGVSADYYVRLEQGRERRSSRQVLDALAEVLRLDDDARAHLGRLADPEPRRRPAAAVERVDPQLRTLLDAWSGQPALVLGRAYDVLAANTLATALFGLDGSVNLLSLVFTEPRGRALYAGHDRVSADAVAGFRQRHGDAPDDPRIRAVLEEMLAQSPEFATLWSRHDVWGKSAAAKTFRHPQVGELVLGMQTFDVRAATGQELVVYQAGPGSTGADGLALLGVLAATSHR
ncbi:helix-turn-helix transcriptional regulator, partial [Pseudonocardia sp. KRD291]|uniref:helix-turn-helix transcriptional regulator n=1 Tax=Pseudonocardia sp. KRD291 TaxID=2792007 RepID=UPI001C4A5E41